MSDQQQGAGGPPSGKKLWVGVAAAIAAAAVFFILFVLPAEFGVDPTGAGEATGLTGLATPEMTELERGALRTGVLTLQDEALRVERREFVIEPFESIEYKYTMDEGAPLAFSWRATDELHYDLHSHPFDGGEAMTEGYGVGDAREQTGLYVAAFEGIHGWYWQNRTLEPVTLTLNAAGHFTATTLFTDRGETETEAAPVQ